MTAAPPYDPATASGSREVAKAIDRLRPALSVHGCSGVGDDTPDPKRFIGDTLALTPGSEADRGGLLGFVVDLVGGGVRVARPFRDVAGSLSTVAERVQERVQSLHLNEPKDFQRFCLGSGAEFERSRDRRPIHSTSDGCGCRAPRPGVSSLVSAAFRHLTPWASSRI